MPFRKSRSDKIRDKADDLGSSAVDALESVRERVTPYVEDAVDRATPAAQSALDRAKETAAPVAERARDTAHDVADRASSSSAAGTVAALAGDAKGRASEVRGQASEVKDKARGKASGAKESAKGSAKEKASEAKGKAKGTAKHTSGKVRGATAPARDRAAEVAAPALERAREAGLTKDQATALFNQEWLPRIQHAVAAAGATASAGVARLPEPAQDSVAKVAPTLVKRKKKGKLLIAIGLLALAGAGAVYYSGQQKKKAGDPWQHAASEQPNQTPTAANPTQASTSDLVGDVERRVDATLAEPGGASPRGRHSAG